MSSHWSIPHILLCKALPVYYLDPSKLPYWKHKALNRGLFSCGVQCTKFKHSNGVIRICITISSSKKQPQRLHLCWPNFGVPLLLLTDQNGGLSSVLGLYSWFITWYASWLANKPTKADMKKSCLLSRLFSCHAFSKCINRTLVSLLGASYWT